MQGHPIRGRFRSDILSGMLTLGTVSSARGYGMSINNSSLLNSSAFRLFVPGFFVCLWLTGWGFWLFALCFVACFCRSYSQFQRCFSDPASVAFRLEFEKLAILALAMLVTFVAQQILRWWF